ncbi:TolC family protein [Ideonella sp. A 288]|uniref:TolC family protein n=1 Tax=Ideonella sp. A 288 TaxID=1962181 RepID=UPI001303B20A|nr:TolC family protein [Ideonella sp. A 288]
MSRSAFRVLVPSRAVPRLARWRQCLPAALAGWLAGAMLLPAMASCVDDDAAVQRAALPGLAEAAPALVEGGRAALRTLVQSALARSAAVGAARLNAEAADQDTDEARAARRPQASANASVGPTLSRAEGVTDSAAARAAGSLSLSQLISDGGRTDRLVDFRERLADAARLGLLGSQEQTVVDTVSQALERSRFRVQAQVQGQHVRQMGCLVQSLEQIVATDRGRASELVQARKGLQQAELTLASTQSQLRQAEQRLRRLVGDPLPDGPSPDAALAALPQAVPALAQVQAEAERAPAIAALDAQADAARELARSVEASTRPQLSWTVSASTHTALGGTAPGGLGRSVSAGLLLNVPLLAPGATAATDAARKRAESARLSRDDALQSRRSRIAELHEQAGNAIDRAHRVAAVLGDSERVRQATRAQWQQLGRRSLFDVMAAEGEHHGLRQAQVDATHDAVQLNALLLSLGRGLQDFLK